MKDSIKQSMTSFIDNVIYSEVNKIIKNVELLAAAVPNTTTEKTDKSSASKIKKDLLVTFKDDSSRTEFENKIKEMF